MTENDTEATPSPIRRSAMAGMENCTIADIEAARTYVGAPEDAGVNTQVGVIPRTKGGNDYYPCAVQFTWFE